MSRTLDFFETGSNDTTRGLGAGKCAILMFSRTVIRRWQEMVGLIVMGRVKVAVITYEMVPRSNCRQTGWSRTSLVLKIEQGILHLDCLADCMEEAQIQT